MQFLKDGDQTVGSDLSRCRICSGAEVSDYPYKVSTEILVTAVSQQKFS